MVQLLCVMLNHQRNPAEVKTAQVSSCGILAAFLRNCVSATFHLLTKEGPQIIMTAFEIINITFPLPSALPQWSNPIPSTKYGNDFPFIDHSRLSQPSSAFRFSLALIWLSLSCCSLRRGKSRHFGYSRKTLLVEARSMLRICLWNIRQLIHKMLKHLILNCSFTLGIWTAQMQFCSQKFSTKLCVLQPLKMLCGWSKYVANEKFAFIKQPLWGWFVWTY